MNQFKTEQESFLAGDFGDKYSERNAGFKILFDEMNNDLS